MRENKIKTKKWGGPEARFGGGLDPEGMLARSQDFQAV